MRKIALITASASLILCCSWINKSKINLNQLEIDNTCGNLLHYLQVDLEDGRIDSMVFDTYSANINEIKQRNNEQRNKNT